MSTVTARDARPPLLVVRAMNPIMRIALRTPLGRLITPFALLEFHGRRSGRLLRVPVGWHQIGTEHVVFTPAAWRVNFDGGLAVTVHAHGRHFPMIGTLDDDADSVANALQSLADQHGSLRPVGIDIPDNHHVTAADVAAVDRALIRFQPTGA